MSRTKPVCRSTHRLCGLYTDVHDGRRGAECQRCHTLDDWTVNQGQNHDFGPFRLGGAHDRLPCERCHGLSGKS